MRLSYTLPLALTLLTLPARAQQLPVLLVEPDSVVAEQLRRHYLAAASEGRERVLCATRITEEVHPSYTLIRVLEVRQDTTVVGTHRHAEVPVVACRDKDFLPMPTYHTHLERCQFSPSDIVTLVGRTARFEGIICGERAVTYQFASLWGAVLEQQAQRLLSQK